MDCQEGNYLVVHETLSLLRDLDAATVAQCAVGLGAFLCMQGVNVNLRVEALTLLLIKLDAAHLAPFTDSLVWLLQDKDGPVRGNAMRVLEKLDAASLASHTDTIVAALADSNNLARITAWDIVECTLDVWGIQPHAATIASYLQSHNICVRQRAARVVERMKTARETRELVVSSVS